MSGHPSKRSKNRFILPFATSGPHNLKDFTKNMEMAAVLYLAESNREKGESHLLKKKDEKIVFLAETYYPLWLTPYGTSNLIFDGLNLTSTTLFYDKIPDPEFFNRDIQRKQKSTEAYAAVLSRNTTYFRSFRGRERMQIEGLITADLQKDLKDYFAYAKELRKPFTAPVELKPKIQDLEINASVKQLSQLKKKITEDIENMNASMRLLNITTARKIKAIRVEIQTTKAKYRKKVAKIENMSTRKIRKIQNQYDRKTTRTSKRFNQKLLKLSANQIKYKKTQRRLRREVKRCETKLQYSKRRKRRKEEAKWILKLKRNKKKLAGIAKEIKVNSKQIRHIENAQRFELNEQKIECLKSIESAHKTFRDLQSSREAATIMKRQEILTLEDNTRYLTRSIQEMIQKKRIALAELEKLTIQNGKRTCGLVNMPFYLVRYEKENKKRYVLYPPSVIAEMGIVTKMRGALGAAKLKALLQPRSEAIVNFLNRLPGVLEKNPMLEASLTEDGIRYSILLRKQLRVGVKKGLQQLMSENWISKTEHDNISKVLYMYSTSMNQKTETIMIVEKVPKWMLESVPKCVVA